MNPIEIPKNFNPKGINHQYMDLNSSDPAELIEQILTYRDYRRGINSKDIGSRTQAIGRFYIEIERMYEIIAEQNSKSKTLFSLNSSILNFIH